MRKKHLKLSMLAMATVMAAGAISLSACNDPTPSDERKPLTDSALSGATLADFTDGAADTFFASHGWTNESVFNALWSSDCVTYADGAMHLSIAENEDGSAETNDGYFAGEARSYQYFGYGDFEVKMKPSNKPGTASAFFTCTGPYDLDEDGNENPWDEIDIEFLGKDTTKVQFNYYVDGVGGHEYMHDLGFDASEEYHEYGYRWTSEYIVWFVDDVPVYKVEKSDETPIPSTPGRILMNYWSGTPEAEGWMGEYSNPGEESADYKWIKTSSTPIGNLPEKVDPDDLVIPEEGWTDIDYSGFGGWSGYEITKTDGITISHDAQKTGYACEGMSLAQSYSWVKFTITNNSELKADVRVDVKKEGASGSVIAVLPESSGISLNAADAAAMITLEANQSLDVALKIKDEFVNQLVVFLNSINSTSPETGSITITDLKGIVNEDVSDQPAVEPEVPEGENSVLTFTSTDSYTVDKSGVAAGEITVTYTDVAGATYQNIQAQAANLAADNNTFSLTITNNGDEAVNLRIDLIGERQVTVGANASMDVCNLSATAIGGSGLYTDTEWGGTMITLAAGEQATVIITYSNDGEMGAVQRVQLYLDTAKYDDTDNHSGNVTFGEFKFSSVTAD